MKGLNLKFILLIALALIIIPSLAFASEDLPTLKLWINGNYVESDVAPFIENERTLVPVRIISETLGFNVIWGEEEQKIVIYAPGNEETDNALMLKIGDTNAYLGVEDIIPLDVAPKIVESRTFVPLRAIAELFNLKVDWDGENRTAIVGDGYTPPTNTPIIGLVAVEETIQEETTISYNPSNPRDNLSVSPYPDRQIKGNISSKDEKIYHIPGQRDYKKTIIDESKGERWFATEEEARSAGWRKAMQ